MAFLEDRAGTTGFTVFPSFFSLCVDLYVLTFACLHACTCGSRRADLRCLFDDSPLYRYCLRPAVPRFS